MGNIPESTVLSLRIIGLRIDRICPSRCTFVCSLASPFAVERDIGSLTDPLWSCQVLAILAVKNSIGIFEASWFYLAILRSHVHEFMRCITIIVCEVHHHERFSGIILLGRGRLPYITSYHETMERESYLFCLIHFGASQLRICE